jgi:hypothetical protein
MVVKWLSETMKGNIDYVTRLGRRKWERPILIKFTSFLKKNWKCWKIRETACSKVRVDEDFSIDDKQIKKNLVPYLRDAKKWGHKVYLWKDVSIVNGRTYDLNYLREKIQTWSWDQATGQPCESPRYDTAENRKFGNPRIEQHTTGRGSRHDTSLEEKHWGKEDDVTPTRVNWTWYYVTMPTASRTTDDVNSTMQTDRQQYNLRSWLPKHADPAGKKKYNRPRNGYT